MRFTVRHVTRYAYAEPVRLGATTVRLRPRADGTVNVAFYDLRCEPEPIASVAQIDACGNAVTRLWFDGEATSLRIESSFEATTLRGNPYDWLVDPEVAVVPMRYPALAGLQPYLSHSADPAVAAFAESVLDEAGKKAVAFLSGLCERIASAVVQERREHGPPRAAAETLERGRGACRDTAVLYMEAARSAGFAARFVSGYVAPSPDTPSELHAWAEVYLPDGGWRGFDPASGLAVAGEHVAVASAPDASGAAPTDGTFSGAASRLETVVTVAVAP